MIIQHNLSAMSGSRNFKINTDARSKSSEHLSTGYRINRAADDAAGLAISEKMRRQIRGLNRAALNAQDGISLIQIADGALGETHDILHRLTELSVQAANDINDTIDRDAIQQEVDQLLEEIDRISDSAEFNQIPVLKVRSLIKAGDGKSSVVNMASTVNVTTPGGNKITRYGTAIDFSDVVSGNIAEVIGKEFTATCTQNCNQIFNFKFTDATSSSTTIVGTSMYVEIGVNDPAITDGAGLVNEIMNQALAQQSNPPFDTYTGDHTYIGHANGIAASGTNLILYSISDGPTYADGMGEVQVGGLIDTEDSLMLQLGAETGVDTELIIKTINTYTLGLESIDVGSHASASAALEMIQDAINFVSDHRAYLGAKQNSLEHTIANLLNTSENVQASESRIRDADMAAEMVNYSKYNILEQVSMSMITHANQNQQGVLQLLS